MVFLKKAKDEDPHILRDLMGERVSETLEVEKCPGWGGHVRNFHLYHWLDDYILEQGKVLIMYINKTKRNRLDFMALLEMLTFNAGHLKAH